MNKKNILITASFEKGRGGGHLVRCAGAVRDLNKMGTAAFLYLPVTQPDGGRSFEEAEITIRNTGIELSEIKFLHDKTEITAHDWNFIVTDRFITPNDEFDFYKNLAPVVGIDEGGSRRAEFDFLIDLLPQANGCCPANQLRIDLLDLPQKKETAREHGILEILVCFGTEDSAGLGSAAARSCYLPFETHVTLITPPGKENDPDYKKLKDAGINLTPPIQDLRNKLGDYDIVITHFGLTAFEALAAGVSVMLVSPTPYHEKVSFAAGFYSQGIGKKAAAQLGDMLFTNDNEGQLFSPVGQLILHINKKECINQGVIDALTVRCTELAKKFGIYKIDKKETLAGFLNSLQPEKQNKCPFCAGDYSMSGKSAVRFEERTYIECPHCKMIFMNRFKLSDIEYTEKYFFENYKKQYGKTYLEDFPNLTSLAKRRLTIIKKLFSGLPDGRRKSVLDIGCAYGAFLDTAQKEGFDVCGIDISQEAVCYVNDTLGIKASAYSITNGSFEKEYEGKSFDVITMWYVIEHFKDAGAVLQKCRKYLRRGGIIAFATPNGKGISALKSKNNFLEKSPADHWTIWNHYDVVSQLKSFGLDVKKIVITGHHPERFPIAEHYITKKYFASKIIYRLFLLLSKLLKLGDTFEVYAESK